MTKGNVLLTGAAGNIGRAVVAQLSRDGFIVDGIVREPLEIPGCAHTYAFDLSDLEQIELACEAIAGKPYYAFVHVAGATYDRLIAGVDLDQALKIMNVNFWSYLAITKTVVRSMARAGSGRIVAVSSVAAGRGQRGNAVYSASKGAMESFNRVLASEYSRKGVLVNCVAPGWVDTKMVSHAKKQQDRITSDVPLGRMAAPEEVADAIAFLLSPSASYISGSVLSIDGALSTAVP